MNSALRILVVSDVSPVVIKGGAERALWAESPSLCFTFRDLEARMDLDTPISAMAVLDQQRRVLLLVHETSSLWSELEASWVQAYGRPIRVPTAIIETGPERR